MKNRRNVSLLLIGLIIMTSLPSLATTSDINAYSNINNMTQEEKDSIGYHRSELVFADKAWTIDGQIAIKKADGSIEELPEFNELYPEWKLEQVQIPSVKPYTHTGYRTEGIEEVCMGRSNADGTRMMMDVPLLSDLKEWEAGMPFRKAEFNDMVEIPKYKGRNSCKEFYSFNADGKEIETKIERLGKDEEVNLSYFNKDTDNYLGWVPKLKKGDSIILRSKDNTNYAARISINSVDRYYEPIVGKISIK